jgi:hypothetical protein
VPDPKAPVVSLSGSPIYHHGEPSPFEAPQGEMCLQQISDHIERHLGKVRSVFHELVSDTVHIDVHIVDDGAGCIRLVTSGMSDLPMAVPEGAGAPKHAELMITLPRHWKLDEASFQSEQWYWPVRLLKSMARFPHKHATWFGFGHTIPNGDPARPYAPDTKLCGAIVLPPVTVPADFRELTIDLRKRITFYSLVPLYREELDFKLRKGADALLDKFDAKGINDLVEIDRANVGRRFLGLF